MSVTASSDGESGSLKAAELLRKLDVGNSVAEYDSELEKYFLETEVYDSLEGGFVDIVAGDKGTGKTALYTILTKRFADISDDDAPEVVVAFNPQGNPIFQNLIQHGVLAEPRYINIWKAYFFGLVGNWLLRTNDQNSSDNLRTLHRLLVGLKLRDHASTPQSIFSRIVGRLESFLDWDAAEFELELGIDGTISVKPRVEFGAPKKENSNIAVDIDGALRHLDACLGEGDRLAWVALDRLDEAFQGSFEIELPALRGLF